MGRKIEDILKIRRDVSPFLIHMTKNRDEHLGAAQLLSEYILGEKTLKQSDNPLSSASYSTDKTGIPVADQKKLFNAICFTEAPLSELHCFFNITGRNMHFEPYGLVFLKDKLKHKGVSPALYINNSEDDQTDVLRSFCACLKEDIETASRILPLIQTFGKLVHPMGDGARPHNKSFDFSWEREWRLPYCYGDLDIVHEDVFIGLCEHDSIEHFENKYSQVFDNRIPFIDPLRNIAYYADRLLDSIKERGLDLSQIF